MTKESKIPYPREISYFLNLRSRSLLQARGRRAVASTSIMKSSRTEIPEAIKKELFENAVNQEWEKVVDIYKKYPYAHMTKITSSGQTALHVAVSEGTVKAVKGLLEHIKRDSNPFEVLNLKTEKGYTPLHFAASADGVKGYVMCRLIIVSVDGVEKASELVRVHDNKGETPIFKAVHYGRLRSFLYLQSIVGDNGGDLSFCLRQGGQSILHGAINREYFDLALAIIYLYKGLVNHCDEQGDSPLHALARKAAAFKSGCTLQGWDKIIYNCVIVKEIKPREPCSKLVPKEEVKDESESSRLEKKILDYGHVEKERTNIDTESGKRSKIALENQRLSRSSNASCFGCFVNFVSMKMPFILGYGKTEVELIHEERKKHLLADQVLDELLNHGTMYDKKSHVLRRGQRKKETEKDLQADPDLKEILEDLNKKVQKCGIRVPDEDLAENSDEEYENDIYASSRMELSPSSGTNAAGTGESKETAILIAAKHGIVEMVKKIIKKFPEAIYDTDKNGKNVLLVVVQKRHLEIFKLLIEKYSKRSIVLQRADKEGNTALHFAATYDEKKVRPWPVPGAALQMQWEIKWLEFVEQNMPANSRFRTNMEGQTPREIFSDSHKSLVKDGGHWLISMATSCSVVAALIVTVAFASSTTVPGGTDSNTGKPILRYNPTFELFAVASLSALCFSVTALITFLAILTSRHQEKDFGKNLPKKILMGLTSLFVSIASMLVTFCSGHFLVFEERFEYAALPVYAVTLFPLCLFAAAQFPLYFDLLHATFWSPFRYDFSSFLKKARKKVKKVFKTCNHRGQ